MKTFRQYVSESTLDFPQELKELNEQGFIIRHGNIGGDDVVLVFHGHMGVEWNKDNLKYRSSVWTYPDGKPVSLSFKKFFNFGEQSELAPEPESLRDVIAKEKLDGSLLCTSVYNGELIARTRGTFDAAQLDNGHEISYLKKKYPKAFNNKYINSEEYSIIYEWVSPNNKIIIDYGAEPDIFLIGIIRHKDYKLLPQYTVDDIAEELGILRPKEFKFSDIATMLQSVKALKGQEGICLYYGPDGQCIKKVKGDEYLRLHRFKSNLTVKNMLELYFQYGMPDYEEFLKHIERDFDYENAVSSEELVRQIIDAKEDIDRKMEEIRTFVDTIQYIPRRDAAAKIFKEIGKENAGIAFSILDGKEFGPKEYKKLLLNKLGK